MNHPTILLDCDPGHDDAIALLLAGVKTNLIGVTVVSGNVSIERTTRNALVTCQLLGIDVPVYPGALGPLTAKPRHAEFITAYPSKKTRAETRSPIHNRSI